MATLKVKDSRSVRIGVTPNKKRVRLRFGTDGANPYESIEVELDAILALGLAHEIQKMIPPGNSPVPPTRARVVGKPKLRVVK